jgi:hypothetical protein
LTTGLRRTGDVVIGLVKMFSGGVTTGGTTVTVNPFVEVATSLVVVTVKSRAPTVAPPAIVILQARPVTEATVVEFTVIPVPLSEHTETPLEKCVLSPVTAREIVAP